ncbi:hypothetical protein [Litoribacillus peritrichatus]|uniref:Uncharacterized protein n=1 Tax=Litoribacillus peritrichatus TaxID=718191 RepID=A0ABP7N7L7_9GAMM
MNKPLLVFFGFLISIVSIILLIQKEEGDAPSVDAQQAENRKTEQSLNPSSLPELSKAEPQSTVNRNTSSAPVSGPIPEPIAAVKDRPSSITLWSQIEDALDIEINGVAAKALTTSPEVVDSIHLGQKIEIPIPQLNKSLLTEIKSTHNQLNRVEIFKGPILNGLDKDNVIITRGKTSTYVVVSTSEGIFSAVIDNATGKTSMTDEADINKNSSNKDDSVTVTGIEMHPPNQPVN